MSPPTAVSSRRFPLSGGQLESLMRLCDASGQAMIVVDDHQRDVYRNHAADQSDASALNNVFELVDHRERVLGHLHTKV